MDPKNGVTKRLDFRPKKNERGLGRGEKTKKTIEVYGCFVRYAMIKGNRNSGPLSDCDRAGWVRTAAALIKNVSN